MRKKEVTYDHLMGGLLLKFVSVDIADIKILMNILGITNFFDTDESDMCKYIKVSDY